MANPSIKPTVFSVGSVPIAIYKSSAAFTGYIKGGQTPDLHVGPHYHVKAFETHQYSRVSADIVLPTIIPPATKTVAWCYEAVARKDNPKVKYVWRFPRLALRVEAQNSVEFRLENRGAGWTPTYYASGSGEGPLSKNQAPYNPTKLPVVTTATTAFIQVECSRNKTHDNVKALFRTFNKNGQQVTGTTLRYVRQAGTFFKQGPGSVPKLRFARYMAHLSKHGMPDALWDVPDGCQMGFAVFRNLKLYDSTAKPPGWVPWNWSRIAYAWSSQPTNFRQLDISSSTITTRNTDIVHAFPQVWYRA